MSESPENGAGMQNIAAGDMGSETKGKEPVVLLGVSVTLPK